MSEDLRALLKAINGAIKRRAHKTPFGTIVLNDAVPLDQIWFAVDGEIIGKITNIGTSHERS